MYTQRNLFKILLNQPEIRFYLPLLEHKRTRPFVFQINQKMVNTIRFQIDLIRLRKVFSVRTRCLIGGQKGNLHRCNMAPIGALQLEAIWAGGMSHEMLHAAASFCLHLSLLINKAGITNIYYFKYLFKLIYIYLYIGNIY